MADCGVLNLDDPTEQFCRSWFSIEVANVGIALVSSWNQHPIPSNFY